MGRASDVKTTSFPLHLQTQIRSLSQTNFLFSETKYSVCLSLCSRFSSLSVHRITQISQSHPPKDPGILLFLDTTKSASQSPGCSLHSPVQQPRVPNWHEVCFSTRLSIYVTNRVLSIPSLQVKCHVFGPLYNPTAGIHPLPME